jgi:hypothetical protein
MSQGLRDIWGLSDPRVRGDASNEQVREFRQTFAEVMAAINQSLQRTAPYCRNSQQSGLDSQRTALYAAYQKVVGQMGSGKSVAASGDADRVLSAANLLRDKARSHMQETESARQEWLQREDELERALDKVVEMQESNHKDADKLGEVIEMIQSRADEGSFGESISAVDQFLTRLNPIYEEFRRKVGSKVDVQTESDSTSAVPQTDSPLKKNSQIREARQLWVQARDQARKDMVEVKAALRKAYRRDAIQLPLVMQKASMLDAVFVELSDELRKSLDSYLKISQAEPGKADGLESKIKGLLQAYKSRIDKDQWLAAIDDDQDLVPNLTIKEPLLEALQRLHDALAA